MCFSRICDRIYIESRLFALPLSTIFTFVVVVVVHMFYLSTVRVKLYTSILPN